MWKVSLHCLHNWQNYAAFSHGSLAVETLSKIISTIQDWANAISAKHFFGKCLECFPSSFTYSCQTMRKTRDSFINWTCGKFSNILCSATINSETILGFRWRFQIASCVAPRHDISIPFKSEELLVGHCSFSIICRQFTYRHCRDTCNARRVTCILLNLRLHLAAVGCILQWALGAEINKYLQLLFATTLTLRRAPCGLQGCKIDSLHFLSGCRIYTRRLNQV